MKISPEEANRILDPEELNNLIMDLGTEIFALEDDVLLAKFKASDKLNELKDTCKTKAEAEWTWQITPEFREYKTLESKMRKAKSRRADLKDRLYILTRKKNW